MRVTRRQFAARTALLSGAVSMMPWWLCAMSAASEQAADERAVSRSAKQGSVNGHPLATTVGQAVLDQGGNSVDAVVAAALAVGVVALPSTGIAGYGGAAMVGGLDDGRISAIDFNGTAPMALTERIYEQMGSEADRARFTGWTSVGVPGVLAGLQKLVDLHGTWPLAKLMEPAIGAARDGFVLTPAMAKQIAGSSVRFQKDPGSMKLFSASGPAPKAGSKFVNLDLARLLESLAQRGRVDEFYKGKYAEQIAQQCRQRGGWLTADDFARFEARAVEPLSLYWGDATVHTLPPTSGGLTVLQTLHTLQALDWPIAMEPAKRTVALVEAMRIAWHDRLRRLGDPQFVYIPKDEMLSRQVAEQSAGRVRQALQHGQPLDGGSDGQSAGGTIHLNSIDGNGMSVALTFTHGDGFGSHVTAEGLGLLMGHGLSRFDPRPGQANSMASGKRPLHNMCPTLVTRDRRVALTLGATGGRRIVSGVTNVLAYYLGAKLPLEQALKAPRVHCEGGLDVLAQVDAATSDELTKYGFVVNQGAVSSLHALGL